MINRLRSGLEGTSLLSAVVYTGVGVLPLFLVSSQILQLEREIGFGVGRLGLATAAFFATAALAANPAASLFVSACAAVSTAGFVASRRTMPVGLSR